MNQFFTLFTVVIVVTSCNPMTTEFSFIYNDDDPNEQIASKMKELLENEFNVEIKLVKGLNTKSNIDSLASNNIDMGLIENYVPYREGVNSVFSIYPKVLHIFYKKEHAPESFGDLVYDQPIYIGRQNSPSYDLMMDLFDFFSLDRSRIEVNLNMLQSDVIVLLNNLLTDEQLIGFRDFKLFSLDDIDNFDRGSVVDGIALKYPRVEPFVIPMQVYTGITEEPVVTLAIDMVMMVRGGMGQVAVTDLIKTMLRNRQKFASVDPLLYMGMREDFDRSKLNFPLHEGARLYLDRDEPTFFERYAELGGVLFSVIIAASSGLISLARWQAQKKKDKIDEFYKELLEVKALIPKMKSVSDGHRRIKEVKASQNRAFEMLISEELVANDSFRIYTELSRETMNDLRIKMRAIKSIHEQVN